MDKFGSLPWSQFLHLSSELVMPAFEEEGYLSSEVRPLRLVFTVG